MDTVIFGMQPAMWAGAAIIISLLIGLYTVAYVEAWHRRKKELLRLEEVERLRQIERLDELERHYELERNRELERNLQLEREREAEREAERQREAGRRIELKALQDAERRRRELQGNRKAIGGRRSGYDYS